MPGGMTLKTLAVDWISCDGGRNLPFLYGRSLIFAPVCAVVERFEHLQFSYGERLLREPLVVCRLNQFCFFAKRQVNLTPCETKDEFR